MRSSLVEFKSIRSGGYFEHTRSVVLIRSQQVVGRNRIISFILQNGVLDIVQWVAEIGECYHAVVIQLNSEVRLVSVGELVFRIRWCLFLAPFHTKNISFERLPLLLEIILLEGAAAVAGLRQVLAVLVRLAGVFELLA